MENQDNHELAQRALSRVAGWPNFEKDNVAWSIARLRLGPNASLREVIELAQKIKEEEL